MVLRTARLGMRAFRADDADSLAAVFGDADVMRFGDGAHDRAWIEGWLDERAREHAADPTCGRWAVVAPHDDRPLGVSGFIPYDDVLGRAEVELTWRLARAHQGHGYATECARALVAYAWERLGLTRLVAIIDPANVASVRVAEKLGMTPGPDVWMPGYDHPDTLFVLERERGG
jgi:ribosomal-protein-alanine N-acetyltransferase